MDSKFYTKWFNRTYEFMKINKNIIVISESILKGFHYAI